MKKSLAFILSMFMLLGLFAACSNQPAASDQPSTQPSEQASADPQESQAPTEPEALTLPIANEKVTYTIWNGPKNSTSGMTSPNDSSAYQEAEKRTNIHIEWMQPAFGQEQEQFNLIIASGKLPDSFFGGHNYYIGGIDQYVKDEQIRDLADLIKKYAPNYNALRNSDETVRRNTMTDAGYVPYIRTINYGIEAEPTWLGGWARQDILDKSGTGIVANNVETYDDFYNMLKALKGDSKIASYYMWSSKTGMEEFLMTGYGVVSGYVNRGGKAVYGPTDPGYLEYLTMMNKWHTEGLIDPEFYSRSGLFAGDMAMLINGDFGAFQFLKMIAMIEMQMPADAGANIQGVAAPVINKGDTRKIAYAGILPLPVGGQLATITYNSDDVIPLIKWFDYFFSEEGSILANYGVEGEGYTLNAEGKPALTELIYANPDDLSLSDAQLRYTMTSQHPMLYNWHVVDTPNSPEKGVKVGKETWDRNFDNSETMPEVTISSDESAEYSSIMNDIKTYVEENTVKFIIGEKPLTEWQSYVDWINSHGIDRCTEIQQAALDRFNKR